MTGQIEHDGIVESTTHDTVCVRITSQSACGSCKAREACGLAESQDKFVTIKTADAAQYTAGESVKVGVRPGAGAFAVLLGYVGALAVLIAVLALSIKILGWNEGRAALASLLSVVVYYCALWLCRKKIEHTIHFTIIKN